MIVVVIDPTNVSVDGSNFGAVADTIANNPNLASAIQIALQNWWQSKQQEFNDEKTQLAAQQQQAVTDAVTNATAQSNAEIADYKAQIEQLQQELEGLKNPPIKWAEFRMAMLSNMAYQRIAIGVIADPSGTGNWTVTTLQNAVTMEHPRVEILSQFWNAMMLLIPKGLEPTETEINLWNGIATQTRVPFSFDSVGLIVPN